MPESDDTWRADYVLYDDRHCPLAIIEAKRTCEDVAKGRQQAKSYADAVEKKYNRRPVSSLRMDLKPVSLMDNILKENVL